MIGMQAKSFNWLVHAYSLVTNHTHILVSTPDGNLPRGMRQLKGVYTQCFNRVHRHVGHVFQGRYKAVIVQKDVYPAGAGALYRAQPGSGADGAQRT